VIRLTADTNVYISALNYHGLPEKVLDLAHTDDIRLAISHAILQELSRILRGKFSWSEFEISETEADILSYAELVTPTVHIDAVKDDPTDNRILECALAGRSDYIVTGDRHLLRIGQFDEIRIVTPAEFLAISTQAT
jgi:uncharacterized protein